MMAENNGLKAENAELRKERDFYCNQVIENGERIQRAIDALNAENAKLLVRIMTQKQTIQAYRDESREWREVAERALAENAKLREACAEILHIAESNDPDFLHWPEIHDELRKLGVKIVKI